MLDVKVVRRQLSRLYLKNGHSCEKLRELLPHTVWNDNQSPHYKLFSVFGTDRGLAGKVESTFCWTVETWRQIQVSERRQKNKRDPFLDTLKSNHLSWALLPSSGQVSFLSRFTSLKLSQACTLVQDNQVFFLQTLCSWPVRFVL